jgi:hypothetical protein
MLKTEAIADAMADDKISPVRHRSIEIIDDNFMDRPNILLEKLAFIMIFRINKYLDNFLTPIHKQINLS